MIKFLFGLIKIIIALLPFLILCFVSRKVNIEKPKRSKQFAMPVISVIYELFALLLMDVCCGWIIKLLDNIPIWISKLSDLSWMPEFLSDAFGSVSEFLRDILNGLNLNFWVFFIANAAIIGVYLLLKKICIKIISKAVKNDGRFHLKIAGAFYDYFSERGAWCLKQSYAGARSYLKLFYYGAVIISSLLMIVSSYFYQHELLNAVFYPVFGIIIMGELYFYLDGVTKKEYSENILGEDEDAYRVVNYSLLRKFLRSLFSDKLLAENTGVNSALAYNMTNDEILGELEKSEDQKIVNFATFYKGLNAAGFELDHNYLYSSLDLLKGESVLFNNPFYNDLIPYAFYPMNRCLLKHKKVLVVLGRHGIEEDITDWLKSGIGAITNIPFMWNIGLLSTQPQDDIDIGIISRSNVLNADVQNANSEFFEDVEFFVVIEPSKLISTAQIGLNMIAKKCRKGENKQIVYCLTDKNCDGLVDAMSHILMTNLTEVSATCKHKGTSSYMCFEADDEYLHHRLVPNISRYLGLGTELSFAALKNQVSKVRWYGGESFPVTDIRWIDKQYYYDLTNYANLPTNQEAMDNYFITSSNLWSAKAEKNNYITVEDEANNMFEVLRDFSTRSTEQGFINVISSEYLLKDYMAENAPIFEHDAKAIPYIVADFARTLRNTVLRLILMLSTGKVLREELIKELSLMGIKVYDLEAQLWHEIYKCYAGVNEVANLSKDYEEAVAETSKRYIILNSTKQGKIGKDILQSAETFNIKTGKLETNYFIENSTFINTAAAELKSAGYISEDEKGESYFLGAELNGHIYQKHLPGQFFTFAGKYYEMRYLTADNKVLVRRAADHISGRPSYRQMRSYAISGVRESTGIGDIKNISGLKIIKEFADIKVNTPGYFRMSRYNDFAAAKKVYFEGEQSGIPERCYRNKEILKIELPEKDGKLSDNIRFTLTLLFNEIFRTIFAENQAYITALTDLSFLEEDKRLPMTYSLKGEGIELSKNCIYIVEDSQLDLGLTVAVERNLQRIFDIALDYIHWHLETLEESLTPPVEPTLPVTFGEEPIGSEEQNKKENSFFGKIKKFFKKIWSKIKGWFKPEKGEGISEADVEDVTDKIDPVPENMPLPEGYPILIKVPDVEPEAAEDLPEGEQVEDASNEAEETEPAEETADVIEAEVTKVTAEATDPADTKNSPAEAAKAIEPSVTAEDKAALMELTFARKPYHQRYYTLYGFENEPAALDLTATAEYLAEFREGQSSLRQAREGKNVAEFIEATFTPDKPNTRYCDFCGAEILGVEYETLADGRDRCLNCSRTAIKTDAEFRKLFEDVRRNMECFFGIKIDAGIRVEMVNSKKLHSKLGKAFVPTPNTDGRILGVAIKDKKKGYTLLVENGSPRMASMLTMAHELTHIWQYLNWNEKAIMRKYSRALNLQIYEGMAKWVEIQYAYLLNEPAVAKREEIVTFYRDDEYGHGFIRYRANYPFSTGTVITRPTPFMDVDTPLEMQYCGQLTVTAPLGAEAAETGGSSNGTVSKGKVRPTPKVNKVYPMKGEISRDAGSLLRYAFEALSETEKNLYVKLLSAIESRAEEYTDFEGEVLRADAARILDFIQRDHPELIWFNYGATYYFDTETEVLERITFKYCLSEAETEKRQQEIKTAISEFLATVNPSMSDYEVAIRIYESIIRLVDYDTLGLEKQKQLPKNDEADDLRSIYGVFVNKKAVCVGYAKATQYLMNLMGIECTLVTSDTHAWNLLKLEGEYYHLDTTWGDSSDTKAENNVSKDISYDCFCITDRDLERLSEHTPSETMPLPVCNATACNYHIRHGLYLTRFDMITVRERLFEFISNGDYTVSFKCSNEGVYKDTVDKLVYGQKFSEAIKYVNLKVKEKLNTGFTYSVDNKKLTLRFKVAKR